MFAKIHHTAYHFWKKHGMGSTLLTETHYKVCMTEKK